MSAATRSTDRPSEPLITVFRVVAIAEAISWVGLLIAMLFKYVLADNATGVEVMGPIHGAIFLGYVVATLAVGVRCRWSPGVILVGLAAAIPPFATLFFEIWAGRTGRLQT